MSKADGAMSDDFLWKNFKSVIPRSGVRVQIPPGAKVPRADSYERHNPSDGRHNGKVEPTRVEGEPPPSSPGQGWRLVQSENLEDTN